MSFICKHCKGEFDDSCAIKDDENNAFCCNGCKNVYAFLNANNLADFYTRLGKNSHTKASSRHFNNESASSLFSQLIKRNNEKPYICELFFMIEGIHCPACVWLNERVISGLDGILELEIDASSKKARILYDERKINLANILNNIVSIGYEPKPYNQMSAKISSLSREHYAKLIVGIACSMNIMWVAIALYSGYFSGISEQSKKLLHFAEFVLASPAVFYTGSAFFSSAITGLKARQITMDFNISLGVLGVYFYSVYAMLTHSAEVYFDSACMLVTFIFAGKFLQTLASKRASLGIEGLSTLLVSKVNTSKDGSNFSLKNINEIEKSDFIMLRAGERAMIDGKIISGLISVDNSSISGESLPLALGENSAVISGMLCLEGTAIYRASAPFSASFLSKLCDMLENATFKKPIIEQKANQISAKFSLVIFLLCISTFIFWRFYSSTDALSVAISVLVIACPCALSLATPIATTLALGTAFKNSVVFKEAKIIESLAKCDIIAFDKTGTLSKGKLKVIKAKFYKDFDEKLLFSLLSASSHPISVGVLEYLKNSKNLKLLELENLQNFIGRGLKASYKGQIIAGGSSEFIGQFCEFSKIPCEFSEYYFCAGNELLAHFVLADELRDEAKSCVSELKKLGLKVIMLSGDKENIASNVAAKLEISEIYAACDPLKKAGIIKELQNKHNVAMIGDGINDIMALSSASVGICMGSGASVSVERSDVVLLRDDLSSLLGSIKLARRTYSVIKENLAISLIYNCLSIPLAMMGYVIPLIAAISMSASSLLVILNSLKLKGKI